MERRRAADGLCARPELALGVIDDVEGRALAVEHAHRGGGDPAEDTVDVRLEGEIPLELEQRFQLRGIVQIRHPQVMLSAHSRPQKRFAGARANAYANGSARRISSSSPGSFGSRGRPGWMIATWQPSAASTSVRNGPALRSLM